MTQPHVPVSWGELIDKITILEIKSERIADAGKLANINRELAELCAVRDRLLPDTVRDAVAGHAATLKAINMELWEVEDRIRDHERAQDFGAGFVALARAVYVTNDRRHAVKKLIDVATGSTLAEEKSYKPYI